MPVVRYTIILFGGVFFLFLVITDGLICFWKGGGGWVGGFFFFVLEYDVVQVGIIVIREKINVDERKSSQASLPGRLNAGQRVLGKPKETLLK
jgi:hypothetical protein